MAPPSRIGVVGAGVFGGYHAAKYAERTDTRLVSIFDPHPERAASVASRFGAQAAPSLDALIGAVDLVSIAAPAGAHADAALKALRAGKPVYVEKPLATSPGDADAIVGEAQRHGLVVACGFLERAAFAAMRLLEVPAAPVTMEALRLGPRSPRGLDVSVVMDLMIHDLDLALLLAKAPPLAVEAESAGPGRGDDVEAEITFENGFVVRLRASRVAEGRERTMRLVYPTGKVEIDFLGDRFADTTGHGLNAAFADTPEGRDRLGASIGAFVAAARGEGAGPLADARDGARALDLALAVEQAARI